MKFKVDLERCQNHGQCTYSASAVFALDADGELAFRKQATGSVYVSDEVDPSVAEDVEEAADMCPVQAISLVG